MYIYYVRSSVKIEHKIFFEIDLKKGIQNWNSNSQVPFGQEFYVFCSFLNISELSTFYR